MTTDMITGRPIAGRTAARLTLTFGWIRKTQLGSSLLSWML